MKKRIPILSLSVMIAGCIIDRLIKFLSLSIVETAGTVTLIPGILELTCTKNTGVSFGLLSGSGWLPILLSVLLIVGVLVFLFLRPLSGLHRFLLGCVLGGALGNLIDRLFLGYVIDMLHFTFFSFPVFNFADILITCGCIALMITIFFEKEPTQTNGEA